LIWWADSPDAWEPSVRIRPLGKDARQRLNPGFAAVGPIKIGSQFLEPGPV